VRNPFINSGGARYRPAFAAEAVLIEDFPEDQESPPGSALLAALGLESRRGVSRAQIESALLEHGAKVKATDQYGLTALVYAMKKKKPEMVKLIKDAGGSY
jgi:ankyrin repeat protein